MMAFPGMSQDVEVYSIINKYIETGRTAIINKDINLINEMLPDLILIKNISKDSCFSHKLTTERVGKEEFLRRIKRMFARDKQINVKVCDITKDEGSGNPVRITRLPENPKSYLTHFQVVISSEHYTISGYLSMIVELLDNTPLIHLLMWQNSLNDGLNYRFDDTNITLDEFDL